MVGLLVGGGLRPGSLGEALAAPPPTSQPAALPRPTPLLQLRPPSLPFGQGVFDFGGAAAFGASSTGGFQLTLGVNAGCFVLPGFEPGLQTDVTFGSEIDTQVTVLPYLRWMLFRSWGFSPYLKGAAGGLFVMMGERTVKLGLFGGGGGVVIGLGGRLALNLELLVLKISPTSSCPLGECTLYRAGLSLSVLFGQARPPLRRYRAPAPPSTSPAAQPSPSPDEVPTPAPDEPGLNDRQRG